jgi:IS605 OrfB family transposase
MLCTLKIKLVPTTQQFSQLVETMKRFNLACDYISRIAFDSKTLGKIGLQKLCYYDVRIKFELSSQMVVRAIGKVSESYKTDKKKLHTFKETGAMVYDQRILSFDGLETASILTLDGRIKVPMVVGDYHQGLMYGRRVRGQADLILQDGVFYLMLVVELPEPPKIDVNDFIGVDLGVVNIATTSDGQVMSGSAVRGIRRRYSNLRKRLQKKGTKSARRLLKKHRRKEQRFATDANHCISKLIVSDAKGTERGIAMEDLGGIRDRLTVKKAQRRELSSWAFSQLRLFVTYKAVLSGIELQFVDPRNTSRECSKCHNVDKKNRKTQSHFECTACGFVAHADINAAVNIRSRAVVNKPYAGV